MKRVGILLSGCGRYDGTEIHEAVLAILSIDRRGGRAEFLAPSAAHAETVDHATGLMVEGERRSALVESARIARGRIAPLSEARPSLLHALLIPGGQGVARTLMHGLGEGGRRCEADAEVASLVRACLDQKKPIGAISLGGSLLSTILGLPLDEDPFSTPPSEIRIDEARGIVWTPGYLGGDRISEIASGIDRMVEEVLRRTGQELPVVG